MDKKDKKAIKKALGTSAKIVCGTVVVLAAVGSAPFDKGQTMKSISKGFTSSAGLSIFSEIDKWMNED